MLAGDSIGECGNSPKFSYSNIANALLYYIKLKSHLSVHLHFLVEWILAIAAWIDVKLAQNETLVSWDQQVYFKQFLTTLVCRPHRFASASVEDFCLNPCLHFCKTAAQMLS